MIAGLARVTAIMPNDPQCWCIPCKNQYNSPSGVTGGKSFHADSHPGKCIPRNTKRTAIAIRAVIILKAIYHRFPGLVVFSAIELGRVGETRACYGELVCINHPLLRSEYLCSDGPRFQSVWKATLGSWLVVVRVEMQKQKDAPPCSTNWGEMKQTVDGFSD
ncbi:Hypothetical protein NTJ_09685 [Nesidiocoris tenuis]|uniref:C2H2-type domain-containing protein n=1 Tax=Nesidiocoris tenuis TaxID=355587 RepID=A0ABN7AZP5_9HEMI|nr:Hypothetical protein NTJ_09685 [Nesidiocoris tenuis]